LLLIAYRICSPAAAVLPFPLCFCPHASCVYAQHTARKGCPWVHATLRCASRPIVRIIVQLLCMPCIIVKDVKCIFSHKRVTPPCSALPRPLSYPSMEPPSPLTPLSDLGDFENASNLLSWHFPRVLRRVLLNCNAASRIATKAGQSTRRACSTAHAEYTRRT
jgi:hypothetical protein